MTDILRPLTIVLLLTIGLACYFLVVGALFEKRISKTIAVVNQLPGRSLGIGFVNFLFFGAIAIALFAVSGGVENRAISVIPLIPALLIAGVLVVLLSFGLSAMITILSERLFPDLSPWRKTFWGTAILSFASAIPTVGWFLLFPYVALTGFGGVILGFFQRTD